MNEEIKLILADTEGYRFKNPCCRWYPKFKNDVLILDRGEVCYLMWEYGGDIYIQINYIKEDGLTRRQYCLGYQGKCDFKWQRLPAKHYEITKILLTRCEETIILMRELRGF